jgi:hypothetical protein
MGNLVIFCNSGLNVRDQTWPTINIIFLKIANLVMRNLVSDYTSILVT